MQLTLSVELMLIIIRISNMNKKKYVWVWLEGKSLLNYIVITLIFWHLTCVLQEEQLRIWKSSAPYGTGNRIVWFSMHYDNYESKEMEKFVILKFWKFPYDRVVDDFTASLECNHH